MEVIFKKVNGDTLSTSYKDITYISLDEIIATKELLEYENGCMIEVVVVQ